ncbi:MAG: hypothetical protein ACK4GJ_02920 [bacterium]
MKKLKKLKELKKHGLQLNSDTLEKNITYDEMINEEFEENVDEEFNYDSLENIMLKEIKNVIRICDICGGEMMLADKDTFICQECGYHLKFNTE